MGEKFIPISEVPPTYDPLKLVKIHNPFSTIFKHDHDGKEIKLPKGLSDITEPIAWFLAHHMAEQEMQAPLTAKELEVRGSDLAGENWSQITKASEGLKPQDVAKRAAELVLDPTNKKDAKRIKELQAA